VEEIEVEPDTSCDEEIARKLFKDINRKLLGIPGDGALIIIGDTKEEEEGADIVLAKTSPQLSQGSQGATATTVEEGDEEQDDVCTEDGVCEDDIKPGESHT
jgi:hypothetical protein